MSSSKSPKRCQSISPNSSAALTQSLIYCLNTDTTPKDKTPSNRRVNRTHTVSGETSFQFAKYAQQTPQINMSQILDEDKPTISKSPRNFLKNEKVADKPLDHYYNLEGYLFKKRQHKIAGIFNDNRHRTRYFGFSKEGQIFWYALTKPASWEGKYKPKWAILTRDIFSIDESYDNKNSHVLIKTHNAKQIHLKIPDLDLKYKWVDALTILSQKYKKKQKEDWEVQELNRIDPRVMLQIMMDIETKFWKDFKVKLENYWKVHKHKNIQKYFERIGYKKLESFMVESFLRKSHMDQEFQNNSSDNKNPENSKLTVATALDTNTAQPKSLILKVLRWAFLITTKGINPEKYGEECLNINS